MKSKIIKLGVLTFLLFVGILVFKNNNVKAKTFYKTFYNCSKIQQSEKGAAKRYATLTDDATITLTGTTTIGDNNHPCIVTNGHKLTVNIKGTVKLKSGAIIDKSFNAFIKADKGSGEIKVNGNNNIVKGPQESKTSAFKFIHADKAFKGNINVLNLNFLEMRSNFSGAVIKAKGKSLLIKNCSFYECALVSPKSSDDGVKDFGGGAIASYAKKTEIYGCNFTSCWCYGGDGEEKGGAVYVPQGDKLIIDSGTTFKYCVTRAKRWVTGDGYNNGDYASKHDCNGGAVHAGTSEVEIGGCTFEGNKAADAGGALHVVGTSTNPSKLYVGIGGQTVIFKNNECSWFPEYNTSGTWTGGGAINTRFCHAFIGPVLDGSKTVISDVNNITDTKVTFEGNISYTTGGALYLNAGSKGIGKSYISANFTNNKSSYGGAIIANKGLGDSYSILNIYKSNFSNNTAQYLNDPAVNGKGKSTGYANYGTNYQPYGGAIYSTQQLRIKGADTSSPTNYFYNNATIYRNGISGNTCGGAIYLNNGNLNNFIDKVNVGSIDSINKANNAKTGGGIYLSSNSYLSIWNNTFVSGNTADYGGGIHLSSNSHLTMGAAKVSKNKAQYGAGINNNGGRVHLNSQWASITSNEASLNGGGIYNTGSATLNINAPSEISLNKANNGGGIFNNSSNVFIYSNLKNISGYDTRINQNIATSRGGGIYNNGQIKFVDGNTKRAHNVNIQENKSDYGAGIYNESSGTITQESSLIKVNCYNNTRDDKTTNLAEIFNDGTFRLINGDIGSNDNKVVALNNRGTFYIAPGGNINFKSDISSDDNLATIVNSKDFIVLAISNQATVTNNNQDGICIYNKENGLLDFNNTKDKFIIRAEGNLAKYGIYNQSSELNKIKACISTLDNSFEVGVYNDGVIDYLDAIIQGCTKHGILNKKDINQIVDSQILNNGSNDNGGGIFADENSNTLFTVNNVIQDNKEGIRVKEGAVVRLSNDQIESSKAESTTTNSLINNAPYNIYIENKGKVYDYSTYHTVDNNYNSVYLTQSYGKVISDNDRAQYHIGYNTYFDRNSNYKPFVLIGYGTYIDVDKKLSDAVKVNGERVSNIAQVYVKSIDRTYTPLGQDSEAGRIIANSNIDNFASSYDINYINDATSRFVHFKLNNTKGLETRYSYKLNNDGKNKLYTVRSWYDATNQVSYPYNSNEELNQNLETSIITCTEKDKFRQVYLTENYDVKYFPATAEKRDTLTNEQLQSITGIHTIENCEIVNTNRYSYAVVKKWWCEDLPITNTILKSNFGIFDKKESWKTIDNNKTYSIYDNDSENNYYKENENISLFAIWSDDAKVLVSHYVMNQDGTYDAGYDYTSYMQFADIGSGYAAGLFGSSYNHSPYVPATILYSQSDHTGFGTYHCYENVPVNNVITEDYIRENLVDNSLIKDNISYYSTCELSGFNNGKVDDSSSCSIKIFYNRKQYNVKVSADSGFNKVAMYNPYQYQLTYTGNGNTSISRLRTEFSVDSEDDYTPLKAENDNNYSSYMKLYLKKNITYNFKLSLSEGTYSNTVILSQNNTYSGYYSGVKIPATLDSQHRCSLTFTPQSDGWYYITGGTLRNSNTLAPLPSLTWSYGYNEVVAYNSDLEKEKSDFSTNLPSSLNAQTRTYYAIDDSEYRENKYVGLEGMINSSGPSNVFDGIYEKNNDNTYKKINSSIKMTSGSRSIIGSVFLPSYGDVEYKIVSKSNNYNINISKQLEKQSYNQGTMPFDFFETSTITSYGFVKVGDLRAIINSDTRINEYINSEKTESSYWYGSPGGGANSSFYGNALISSLDDDAYLPADKAYLSMTIRYYRKTFTIKAIAGLNALSASVSTDNFENQSHSQNEITERYFLKSDNPFNLPAENFKRIYLDGQIRDGYTGSWTSSVAPYNQAFSTVYLNKVTTNLPIILNADTTFTLNAIVKRNITIEHYMLSTDGTYELQENKTRYITDSSLEKIKPSEYKDSSLEYEKNNIKYKYLSHADYLGETYSNTNSYITFVDNDLNVVVKLFYDRRVIPIYLYANKYIDEVEATSNSIKNTNDTGYTFYYDKITDDNQTHGGKQLNSDNNKPIRAYYGEKINLSTSLKDSSENYTVEFGGWSNGEYEFNSANIECATSEYEYQVEAVPYKHISAWAKNVVNKWHIRYHKNYVNDEQNCGHDSEIENTRKRHMMYDYTPSMSTGYEDWDMVEDIDCVDSSDNVIRTATVEGEAFDGKPSYKLLGWHTDTGDEFNFGDTISRFDSNGDYNPYYNTSTRTIDLYAHWKDISPKINIYTQDVYYEVGSEITQDDLFKDIHVSDGKGHSLSNSESELGIVKVEVLKEYENLYKYPEGENVVADTPLNESDYSSVLNTDNAKTYLVTVKVTSEIDGKEVEAMKTFKVIVYENLLSKLYIRAIDKEMLPSLPINSIWREPSNYARLIKSLNKGTSSDFSKKRKDAKYIFAFNASDMEEIKEKIKANGFKYKDVIKEENIKKQPE